MAGWAPEWRCSEALGPAASAGFPPLLHPSAACRLPPAACGILWKEKSVLCQDVLSWASGIARGTLWTAQGPLSGAAPRTWVSADVKWVWALREGPRADAEGKRCAARLWRPRHTLSPGAADQLHKPGSPSGRMEPRRYWPGDPCPSGLGNWQEPPRGACRCVHAP